MSQGEAVTPDPGSGLAVGLVFGGRSVEHEVSITSARTVARGLTEAGHRVVPFAIAPDGVWADEATSRRALAGDLDRLPAGGGPVGPSPGRFVGTRLDAVFPIAHGTWGEDGTLQGLFEMLDLPYVGAGVAASAVAMDKVAAKAQLRAAGLPVVEDRVVDAAAFAADPAAALAGVEALGEPLFVKPAVGGSSVGVRKVATRADLEEAVAFALGFDERVLVERAVAGRELECAVLGDLHLEASVVGEIVPGAEFYDYADKYLDDAARLEAPADLPEPLAERLRGLAVDAFAALGGTGMARVDFFLEDELEDEPEDEPSGRGGGDDPRLWINEINTLPGFTAISMYPRLWGLSGLGLPALLDRLVGHAIDRHRRRARLDRAIHDWIESLGPDA